MNKPSEEQQLIIDYVKQGFNIQVQAVAGSGKSTTVLSLAKQCHDKKILQLTYNSSLRLEIKEKVKELELENISVHTFHSLAVKYYSSDSHTDTGMRNVLLKKPYPRVPIKPIDILVIDENQDLTQLYFQFTLKFLLDMGTKIQIICLGDYRQCIYEFKGADMRFLTFADKIWSRYIYIDNREFKHCTLKTSYRITDQMANFVNKALLGEEIMVTCRNGEPIYYLRYARQNIENCLVYNINTLLEGGAKPSDIFVLAASIKGKSVRMFENRLVHENIPCYVPSYETAKLDERIIDGKIVFSTFHSVKGRQRPIVIILGFDNNYFTQFARNAPKDCCPNALYVGATRAQSKLFVVENDQFAGDRQLEFMKMNHKQLNDSNFVTFKGMQRNFDDYDGEFYDVKALIDKRYETPTKMVQFIPDLVLSKINPILNKIYELSSNTTFDLDIPNIVQTTNGFEDVSEINGIAIPLYFYEKKSQKIVLKDMVLQAIKEIKPNEQSYLKSFVSQLPETYEDISDYLFMANLYNSVQERLHFKLKQIQNYNWLNQEILDKCVMRLENLMENKETTPEFEDMFIHNSMEEMHVQKIDPILHQHFPPTVFFRFTAIVDVITDDCVWELKCTNSISIEHKIQLVVYAWLWEVMEKPAKKFKLFNIKTGEHYTLNYDLAELTEIVVMILKGKYFNQEKKSDNDFLEDCFQYMDNVSVFKLIKSTEEFIMKTSCEDDNEDDENVCSDKVCQF